MTKIQKINQPPMEGSPRLVRQEPMQPPVNTLSFARHITDMSESRYTAYISQLVGSIAEQGERMAKRADLSEFHRYREMIRKLLDETVSNGFAFRKFRKFDLKGRNKTFALIQCINERLDEILKVLLQEEADHLALLDSVDDIRGLLVDLLM